MKPLDASELKKIVQQSGFLHCGIAKAEFLEKDAPRLENWLKQGMQGKMQYLENHFDKRLDPTLLVPGAKTVISLAYNYFPKETQPQNVPKIAKYAYGKDYHFVIKSKLADITQWMIEKYGNFNFRVFVDSGPVLERAWAEKSGLGWIGKHGLLINKKSGSYFFLAEIICDLEFIPDNPNITDFCGTCNACVDACPTEAILPNKTLNASKCISYLTIELKEEIPHDFKNKLHDWVFGCDICQDVCPWNRFSEPNIEPNFEPHPDLLRMNNQDWKDLTEDIFNLIFKKSAVKRAGFKKLKDSILFATSFKSKK
jgi:epoxyqueuosine reductase